jgi:hypothetical protein
MGLQETKKLLYSKGNGEQTKEAAHRMGENLYQEAQKTLNSQRINAAVKK